MIKNKNQDKRIKTRKINYYYLKDPIHKEINFSSQKWIGDFVFSYEMTRLLEIKQLGVNFRTFHSATHNRYSHCLGAFSVAQKFVKHFYSKTSKDDIKLFLVAALLHDIGHGPYSHVFEKIAPINHEEIGRKIIKDPNLNIYHLLKKNKISPDLLISVYKGECKQEWISRLISSNLDVDRIDYLLRDSYYIGTSFSTIDVDFLIERSLLMDNDIFFYKSATNYIESFLLGRYYMHEEIYDNKNSYIYEWILVKVFERLKDLKEKFYENREKIYFYDFYEWIVFEKDVDIHNVYIHLNDNNLNSFLWSLKILEDDVINSFVNSFFGKEQIEAHNFSDNVLETVKKQTQNINIDNKYLYHVQEKGKKNIYYDGEKNSINIYDSYKKKAMKFPISRISGFSKNQKENNNKIILVNKNLIY